MFGPDGHLYVSSRLSDSILCYNGQTGAFLGPFASSPVGFSQGPEHLAFGPDGHLYVSNPHHPTNRIVRYDGQTGAFLDGFITRSQGLSSPTGFVFQTIDLPTLLLVRAGQGIGRVISSPAGIDCGSVCRHNFPPNTTLTLTATPDANSQFIGWEGGDCTGTGACTLTLTQLTTITAHFAPKAQPVPVTRRLILQQQGDGEGTVVSNPVGIRCNPTCAFNFKDNEVVTLSATAASGSTFAGWDGNPCSGVGPCKVVMTEDRVIVYLLNLNEGSDGEGDGDVGD